jgi:hypothetical protein
MDMTQHESHSRITILLKVENVFIRECLDTSDGQVGSCLGIHHVTLCHTSITILHK